MYKENIPIWQKDLDIKRVKSLQVAWTFLLDLEKS